MVKEDGLRGRVFSCPDYVAQNVAPKSGLARYRPNLPHREVHMPLRNPGRLGHPLEEHDQSIGEAIGLKGEQLVVGQIRNRHQDLALRQPALVAAQSKSRKAA